MSTLGITELRSLIAVAAFAGVGRAAEALRVSQPTVSAHLRALEATTGVSLVERRGRNIAFTLQGEALVRQAYRIIALHDAALDSITTPSPEALVIASSDMAIAAALRTASKVLSERHPDRSVTFRFHRTERLRELAHTHTADVILGFGDFNPAAIPVGEVPVTWFRSASVSVVPDALVVYTAPCKLRESIMATEYAHFPIARECLELTGVLDAVRAGVGMTALPIAHRSEQGLAEITTMEPPKPLQSSVVFSKRLPQATKDAVLVELREAMAPAFV